MTKFLFHTISPVHVGNGNSLNCLFDCIIKNNKLFKISIDRYTIDELKTMIKNINESGLNKQTTKYMASIAQKYVIEEDGIEVVADSTEIDTSQTMEIEEFINIDGNPYIPGSSIKGTFLSYITYYPKNKVSDIIFRDAPFERRLLKITRLNKIEKNEVDFLNYLEIIPPEEKIEVEILHNNFYGENGPSDIIGQYRDKIKDINKKLINAEFEWIENQKRLLQRQRNAISEEVIKDLDEFYKNINRENERSLLIRIGKGKPKMWITKNEKNLSKTRKVTYIYGNYYPFGWVKVEKK